MIRLKKIEIVSSDKNIILHIHFDFDKYHKDKKFFDGFIDYIKDFSSGLFRVDYARNYLLRLTGLSVSDAYVVLILSRLFFNYRRCLGFV